MVAFFRSWLASIMPFSGKLFGTGQTAKTVPNEDPPDKTEESQTKESQREEEDPQSLRNSSRWLRTRVIVRHPPLQAQRK